MARAARPLEERRDPACGPKLAHELDVADVDAELQRCRRYQRLQLACFQALLGGEPALLRHAAVMRHYVGGTEKFRQVPRHTLRHSSRVDEHERGSMLDDEI